LWRQITTLQREARPRNDDFGRSDHGTLSGAD